MIKELDCVALTIDLPECGLHRGDVGAVVLIHGNGEAFETEFIDSEGETLAIKTLKLDQIRRVEFEDVALEGSIPHVASRADSNGSHRVDQKKEVGDES